MVSLLKHMLVPMLTRLVLLFIVYCTGAYLNSGPGLVQFPRLPCVLSFLTVLGDPTFFLCFLRSFRGVFFFSFFLELLPGFPWDGYFWEFLGTKLDLSGIGHSSTSSCYVLWF